MPPLIAHNPPLTAACTTPGCLLASSYLKQYVNLTVDPCSDFFQYTCGSWLNSPRIKQKSIAYNVLNEVQDENLRRLSNILEGTYEDILKNLKTNTDGFNIQEQADIDRENFQLAQDYYRVCTNEKQLAAFGPTSIFGDIVYIQNTLDGTTDKADALAQILAFFTRQRIPSLVDIKIITNQADHDFDAPSIQTYNPYIVSERTVVSTLKLILGTPKNNKHIVAESQRIGLTLWSLDQINTAAKNYLKVQEKLQEIKQLVDNTSKSADEWYLTLKQVQLTSSSINWKAFLANMISLEHANSPDADLASSKLHLQEIDKLVSSLSIKELQDFFSAHFVYQRFMDLAFAAPDENPSSTDGQATSSYISLKKLTCAGEVGSYFYNGIGRYFVLETLGGAKEKQQVDAFVHKFQDAFVSHLSEVSWLDTHTRDLAAKKIQAITTRVAFNTESPDWRNPTSIKDYYQNYAVNASNYFQSKSTFNSWIVDKQWKALGTNVSNEWYSDGSVQLVNAQYVPWRNQIEIPIGILQGFQYNSDFPGYINYGAVGSTIGHEFTHALDSSGRLSNSRGYDEDWFSQTSAKSFDDRSQCFVNQYSKDFLHNEVTNKDVNVNGEQTLAENIADAGGLSLALIAYREYASQLSQPESPLLGFEELTPEQLLFISFGSSRCGYMPPNINGFDPADPHAPLKFRILNTLKNNAEFASAFKCEADTPMNSHKNEKDRCTIW